MTTAQVPGGTRRVVVLGAGAGGLSMANRLARHSRSEPPLEVLLVDRSGDHLYAAGLTAVLFGEAEPHAIRRPLTELARPGVRLTAGEVWSIDPVASLVQGSFGELPYDDLVVALGAECRWPEGTTPPCGDLSPWSLSGALAGRDALQGVGPGTHVVIGPSTLTYRCPPAIFDLAVKVRLRTGAHVDVVHPWPRPLAPFGHEAVSAFSAMLTGAGVGFHGSFTIDHVTSDAVVADSGALRPYDVALIVPPHGPPPALLGTPLAGPGGWPAVRYPDLTAEGFPTVSVIGDAASVSLQAGMAGTLAVFEGGYVAERLVAPHTGGMARSTPRMAAICFVDPGGKGSFIHCDFTGPASRSGPPQCTLMPPLQFFTEAKRLFAEEWFASTLGGDVI